MKLFFILINLFNIFCSTNNISKTNILKILTDINPEKQSQFSKICDDILLKLCFDIKETFKLNIEKFKQSFEKQIFKKQIFENDKHNKSYSNNKYVKYNINNKYNKNNKFILLLINNILKPINIIWESNELDLKKSIQLLFIEYDQLKSILMYQKNLVNDCCKIKFSNLDLFNFEKGFIEINEQKCFNKEHLQYEEINNSNELQDIKKEKYIDEPSCSKSKSNLKRQQSSSDCANEEEKQPIPLKINKKDNLKRQQSSSSYTNVEKQPTPLKIYKKDNNLKRTQESTSNCNEEEKPIPLKINKKDKIHLNDFDTKKSLDTEIYIKLIVKNKFNSFFITQFRLYYLLDMLKKDIYIHIDTYSSLILYELKYKIFQNDKFKLEQAQEFIKNMNQDLESSVDEIVNQFKGIISDRL